MRWSLLFLSMLLALPSLAAELPLVRPEFYRVQVGDDPTWAQADFDDRSWPQFEQSRFPETKPPGVQWIRYHLEIPEALKGRKLGMVVNLLGAAEIYIDGEHLVSIGKVGTSRANEEPRIDWSSTTVYPLADGLLPPGNHVIAVRYSDHFRSELAWKGETSWLSFVIGDLDELLHKTREREIGFRIHQTFPMSGLIIFTLLHLFIWRLQPERMENLYFMCLTASCLVVVFMEWQVRLAETPDEHNLYLRTLFVFFAAMSLSMVRFVHSITWEETQTSFRILLVLGLAGLVFELVFTAMGNVVGFGFFLLCTVEVVRVVLMHYSKMQEGTWIIGLGALPLLITGSYQSLSAILPQLENMLAPWHDYMLLVLLSSVSLYLARSMAKSNRMLKQQLAEIQTLSEKTLRQEVEAVQLAEAHRQKEEELEQARQLQLSLLPKRLPQIEGLRIGVCMETATQVGGDYYDFIEGDDGALNGVIGDATGHGLQAGTMVTAVKGLYHSLVGNSDLAAALNLISQTIKSMGFRKVFMALAMFRYRDGHLLLASAGMPEILFYRAATRELEVVSFKSLPLGGVAFPYQEVRFELEPGDTLLLRSDGLEESFNEAQEMLGPERVKALFADVADLPPERIIEELIDLGHDWNDQGAWEDDVALMVLQRTT